MLKKWLLGRDATRGRDCFFWNSVSGFLNALQSTFILIVLQRVADEGVSGVFTIAFATANLMLAIGKYGVRYYQVADVRLTYTYGDYFYNRLFTSGAMVIATLAFCLFSFLWGGYTADKALFCLVLCLQKVVDSVEDAVQGEYQKKGHLDTAGRAMSLRTLLTVISFIVGFLFTKTLTGAALVSLVVSVAAFAYFTWLLEGEMGKPVRGEGTRRAVFSLLLACLPLFASSFLSLFIVNAPKYAIDGLLSSEAQAIYGFVSLPVFVVSLLAECLFRPMVTGFAKAWNDGRFGAFLKKLWLVVGGIALLTVVCVVGGVIVGVPVLGIMFNTDLAPYWFSVAVLLVGSGLLSLTSFLTMILTVIQHPTSIAVAYLLAAAVSLPISRFFVGRMELPGASFAYLVVIALLCVTVVSFLAYFILKEKGERGNAASSV